MSITDAVIEQGWDRNKDAVPPMPVVEEPDVSDTFSKKPFNITALGVNNTFIAVNDRMADKRVKMAIRLKNTPISRISHWKDYTGDDLGAHKDKAAVFVLQVYPHNSKLAIKFNGMKKKLVVKRFGEVKVGMTYNLIDQGSRIFGDISESLNMAIPTIGATWNVITDETHYLVGKEISELGNKYIFTR